MSQVWMQLWGHVTGVIIVLMMVMFIGIWAWAWASQHQKPFARMAALPMHDDDDHARQALAKDEQP